MDDIGGSILSLVVFGTFFGWLFFPGYFNMVWYAIEYRVPYGQVHVGNKPKDCDCLSLLHQQQRTEE